MNSDVTVLYTCNDAPHYRQMMELSIRSWKRFHPDWKTEIFQLQSANTLVDTVTWHLGSRAGAITKSLMARKDSWDGRVNSFNEKVDAFRSVKDSCVLFLDCDTFVNRPLDSLVERFQGVDVLAQNAYETFPPKPGFGDASFPRINAGAFMMSATFARVFAEYASTYPIENLYGADEYLFSYCLHHSDKVKVRFIGDLQATNNVGARSVDKYVGEAHVFHYIYHKRRMYTQLKGLLKQAS